MAEGTPIGGWQKDRSIPSGIVIPAGDSSPASEANEIGPRQQAAIALEADWGTRVSMPCTVAK